MENILFTIAVDGTVSLWAPINSWEPHILYQRASISIDCFETNGPLPSSIFTSAYCILVDSTELTRALETVFNRINGTNAAASGDLEKIAEIARKSPEICLILNQRDDKLCVWGFDVLSPSISYLTLINMRSKWTTEMESL
jgi:hypothetical protein